MARPRTPIGTFGEISLREGAGGQVRARDAFRDDDGQLRRVPATGATQQDGRAQAQGAARAAASQRSATANSPPTAPSPRSSRSGSPTSTWRASSPPSTRALYERNMRQLVMPAFEHYALREITVRKVDQFIKTLATTKSYSMAKQAQDRAQPRLRAGGPVRRDARRTRCATPLGCASRPPRRWR